MPTTEEQIQELELQIIRLKERSVFDLRVKLAEAKGLVVDLARKIEELTGSAPVTNGRRKPRVSITIAQVIEAIKGGAVNHLAIAAKLGCSTATVAKKIKDEGKKAGIKSTGKRAFFKLTVTERSQTKERPLGRTTVE